MKQISLDNGATYITPEAAIDSMSWDAIAQMMDDDTREAIAADLAPCSELEFLTRYLEQAPANLIIG